MSLLPEINQASAEINKLVAQANIHQTIAPVDPAAFTDPADTALLASRDPVIREVSVGMTGVEAVQRTVSGTPPLSLPNSLGKPLKAWEVDVLPKQDLNGYDSPWPAGGGKNKFHFSAGREGYEWSDGCGFSAINVDDYFVTLYGTASESHAFSIIGATITLKAGTYKLSTSANTIMFTLLKASDLSILGNSYGGAFTLAEDTECTFNIITISGSAYGTSTTVYIQIESGDTATEIVPYSNICPISGWDEVNVTMTGKNLLGINEAYGTVRTITITDGVATGTVMAFSGRFINIPKHLVGKNLTLSAKVAVPETATRIYAKANINGININGNDVVSGTTGITTVSFTPTSTSDYFRLTYGSGYGTLTVSDFQLELGSTATDFEAYQGNTYTITLPQTVYTGTIGSEGGESRDAIVDLGTLDWNYRESNTTFWALLPNSQIYDANTLPPMLCEAYPTGLTKGYTSTAINDKTIIMATGRRYVLIKDTDYTDIDLFKASLNGVHLVYELETPTQFAVTAPTIPTPTGNATTWATAEDGIVESMEVTYYKSE